MKKIASTPAANFAGHRPDRHHLSAARAGVLDRLNEQSWQSIVDLSALSGLHGNTVREHLDALVNGGYAQRRRAAPSGRGRPAWLYAATPHAEHGEYAALAMALAGQMARTSATAHADAVTAGKTWGHSLVGEETADGPLATRRRVVEILDELGFDPDPDGDCKSIRLRRCPLIDAARVEPDVVCGVHDGIVKGALESLGADPAHSELHAFHEPDACHLQL